MIFTIKNMDHKYVFVENKKTHIYNGYAFTDKKGRCIIIVYGERHKDLITEYLLKTPS